jgi:protein SCO1
MNHNRSTLPHPAVLARCCQGIWLLGVVMGMLAATHAAAHTPLPKPTGLERRELRVPVPDFILEDHNGVPLSFESLRGHAIIINFMYTSCPDICPLLTASVKRVQDQLSASEQNNVRFLSITTDPEIDTPAILRAYAERHGVDLSNWSFLTGQLQTLAKVWQSFGVTVRKQAKGLIDHTTLTTIVDAEGRMRFVYFGSYPNPDTMLRDLRTLEKSND